MSDNLLNKVIENANKEFTVKINSETKEMSLFQVILFLQTKEIDYIVIQEKD